MSSWWTDLTASYNHVIATYSDERLEDWFLMDSPVTGVLITATYIFLVKFLLPKYMEKRQAYELKTVMLLYNFAMVALSGYIFIEFGLSGWFTHYTMGCQLVDYSTSPQAMKMLNVCWWFMISKYIEFTDTIIFCLRKKHNQVTFLHVVHHSIMPFSCYLAVKLGGGGGMGTFHCLLNSLVHFLMYTYYGIAALGPRFQRYLWWKVYMTRIQMIQFMLDALHSSQLFFTDCSYPRYFGYTIFVYSIFFMCIFTNFYIKEYVKEKKMHAKHSKDVKNKKI